ITFIAAMTNHLSNSTASPLYRLKGSLCTEQLLAREKDAREKGCNDPLVNYAYAHLLYDSKRAAEARPLNKSAAEQLRLNRYPLTRAVGAWARIYSAVPDGPEKDAAWQKCRDTICAVLVNWQFKNIDRRIMLEQLSLWLEDEPVERFKDLYDNVRELTGADPCLPNMIGGRYFIKAAWAVRGGKWANAVPDSAWKPFYDKLGQSRESLLRAWKIEPKYPEAATDMITVSMGAGRELQEDERTWLDRALEAQFDYTP